MSCSSRNILPLGRSVSMATRGCEVLRGGPPLRPPSPTGATQGTRRRARVSVSSTELTDTEHRRGARQDTNSRFTEPAADARTHVNVVASSGERTCVSSGKRRAPPLHRRRRERMPAANDEREPDGKHVAARILGRLWSRVILRRTLPDNGR